MPQIFATRNAEAHDARTPQVVAPVVVVVFVGLSGTSVSGQFGS